MSTFTTASYTGYPVLVSHHNIYNVLYLSLTLTQEVTSNPIDFVTIFEVLCHFCIRPKTAHMTSEIKALYSILEELSLICGARDNSW